MKGRITFILALAISMIGCNTHSNEPLELDNGQKWKVVETMLIYIQNMENDVTSFKGKTLDEYKNLSKDLKKNIDLLVSNCTMKGQAHDELHKWLLPYMKLVDKFSATETAQEASEYFQQIKKSFTNFNQYFK